MTRIAILAAITIIAFIYISKFLKGRKGETPELRRLILLKSRQYNLEPALIRAIIKVESNYDPRARNPMDPSYGYMQITPVLAADQGLIADGKRPSKSDIEKIFVPENNLDVGCWFLNKLKTKYPSFDEYVQMYNVGEAGFNRGVRNRPYLNKVRKYYEKYS